MKKIRQAVLIVAAWFAATAISDAQSYSLSPNDTIIAYGIMEDLETLIIQQNNITTDTLQLKWKKVSESVPPNWDISVCDNQNCYTTLEDSGTMNPVNPNDYGFLLIHCTPHVNFGTAIIRYAVWNINFPNLKDTLTFIIHANPTGIAVVSLDAPSVWIAQNKIHLQNNKDDFYSISFMDMNGKEVFKTNISNESEYELPGLPISVYIIQLYGKQKLYMQKVFYQP
ncbi:MAG: T9SS type A sorting domain-containing protein [Bacteroidia bacterium]